MAEFPALPLWTDALIGDTYHLRPAEFGAYLRLLICAWRTRDCALPNDDVFLGRAIGDPKNWYRLKPIVMPFFRLGPDNRYRQTRLSDEREYCTRTAARASAGGRAKALKRNNRDAANRVLNECQTPAPIPTPIPTPSKEEKRLSPESGSPVAIAPSLFPVEEVSPKKTKPHGLNGHASDFQIFYDVFPLHKSRRAAEKAYASAMKRGASPAEILRGAAAYAADPKRDPEHTKYPATWLNADCWLDDDGGPGKGAEDGLRQSIKEIEELNRR